MRWWDYILFAPLFLSTSESLHLYLTLRLFFRLLSLSHSSSLFFHHAKCLLPILGVTGVTCRLDDCIQCFKVLSIHHFKPFRSPNVSNHKIQKIIYQLIPLSHAACIKTPHKCRSEVLKAFYHQISQRMVHSPVTLQPEWKTIKSNCLVWPFPLVIS